MRDLAILLCFSYLLMPPVQCGFQSLVGVVGDAAIALHRAISLVERDLARMTGRPLVEGLKLRD